MSYPKALKGNPKIIFFTDFDGKLLDTLVRDDFLMLAKLQAPLHSKTASDPYM